MWNVQFTVYEMALWMRQIGNDILQNRLRVLERYRELRWRRLKIEFRNTDQNESLEF